MLVYRIANPKYKNNILSGIGAEKVGGRWNEIGTRAVYCSENASLALLEYYIHSNNIALLPKEIVITKIEIPDDFIISELEELPKRWIQYPYSSKTAEIFTRLSQDRDFFALKVPSAVIPIENNFVLNPLYKDFGQVNIIEYIPLVIDERLKSMK